jgi:ABC-type nitrate/sulfonate/bicarbonate transport system substrate-binding protein
MRYGKEFPGFLISTYAARTDWAEQNPHMVKDFIRSLLQANRELQGNPQRLHREISERLLFEPKLAQAAADGFMEEQVWDANGGLDPKRIQATLDILRKGKAFPAELTPEDVADLEYLNDVLDEIGWK